MNLHSSLKLAIGGLLLSACVSGNPEPQPPSWEEYKAAMTQTVDGKPLFLIDGDTPVSEKALHEIYDRLVARFRDEVAGIAKIDQRSTVLTVNGIDDIWNSTQRKDLTYCVDNAWGADKQRVVNEMASATAAWEAVANLKFRYVPAQDGACTSSPPGVLFAVRKQASGGGCAFFPSIQDSCEGTRVLTYSLLNVPQGPPVTTTGILRHELGHIIGLRHEHIRSGFPCNGGFEGTTDSRSVTAYDSASVMHYPWCQGGTNTGDLALTARDIQGISSLYGAPGTNPVCGNRTVEAGEQCDDGNTTSGDGCSSTCQIEGGTPTTDVKSGSVARNAFSHLAPYTVKPGTTFSAVMTGTGDPDLYVRWGAQPTTTTYNCRPFTSGASETCTLTVPPNVTTAFVSVRGFTRATYTVTTTYTRP
jgi:serine protease